MLSHTESLSLGSLAAECAPMIQTNRVVGCTYLTVSQTVFFVVAIPLKRDLTSEPSTDYTFQNVPWL